ncbi:MAG: 50S ribosomal protein L18 [Candidatus Yanofskybacteria bacterium]|nr:50S ribosomal protein L18 [Candidatus Yanofskybacteria bacterium]
MESKKKQKNRARRHKRIRAIIKGTSERPRVAVFKSNKHVFVQFIDDTIGKTILSSKIISAKKSKMKGTKTTKAGSIGEMLAEKAKELGISEAVFDRGGFKFHGRVKAVAEGLKKGGIKI